MPTSTSTLVTTAKALSGGVTEIAPRGATYRITFGGTWLAGESWLFSLVSTIGDFTFGYGNITQATANNGYVHSQKGYLADSNQFDFSASGDITGWEQQNAGAGIILYTTQYGAVDTVQSFSAYQGNLAVFGRKSIQIWQTNADPTLYNLVQTLSNIGTFAPFSTASLGDLDVFFLSDTGIRSIRARETTLNAFVNDLGSPIDKIIQETLATLSATQKASCCAVVEPTQNRYWLFIPNAAGTAGYIYVLSYFPSNKIQGWSRYVSSYEDNNVQLTITAVGAVPNIITVTGPDVNGNTILLCTSAAGTTIVDTATDIKNAINADTGTTGYTATSVSNVVNIFPPAGVRINPALIQTGGNGHITGALSVLSHNFVPQKFVVFNGQVYARTATTVFLYGGTTGLIYDGAVATLQVPFMDIKKPGHVKTAEHFDVDLEGAWNISATPDWIGGTMIPIMLAQENPTFDGGWIAFNSEGTHYSIQGDTTGYTFAKISSLILYYQLAQTPDE